MEELDKYMRKDIIEYLNGCDLIKCKITSKTFNIKYDVNYDVNFFTRECRKHTLGINRTKKHDDISTDIVELFNYSVMIGSFTKDTIYFLELYDYCKKGLVNIARAFINYMNHDAKLFELCMSWGLHGAISNGHEDIINLLIQEGATNLNGELGVACMNHDQNIINILVKNGATHCLHCMKSMDEHIKK